MGRRWTQSDIDKLNLKIVHVSLNSVQKKPKVIRKEPKALQEMKQLLQLLKIPFEVEYRFHDYRKFRFDIALVEKKIAIEYEGVMSKKSRHTTVTGYSKDTDKYNLAQTLGWKVFRYTVINYKNMYLDIELLLKEQK